MILAYFACFAIINAIVRGSEAIVGHLLPKAHGTGNDVLHTAVVALLGGVIAAALVIAAVILRGIVRARRGRQP